MERVPTVVQKTATVLVVGIALMVFCLILFQVYLGKTDAEMLTGRGPVVSNNFLQLK